MENNLSEKTPFWLDPKKRAIFFQFLTLCMVGMLGYYLVSNTLQNLERQSIATGFGFLHKESSFEIGESLIDYSAASSYGRALIVGALNTLYVSFIGIIITVIFGTFIGVARLSTNWLVSRLAAIYIEVMQNIPVLLQLFFWYAIFYETFTRPFLPPDRPFIPYPAFFCATVGLPLRFPRPIRHMPIWPSPFWSAVSSFIWCAGGQKNVRNKPDSFFRYFECPWGCC